MNMYPVWNHEDKELTLTEVCGSHRGICICARVTDEGKALYGIKIVGPTFPEALALFEPHIQRKIR